MEANKNQILIWKMKKIISYIGGGVKMTKQFRHEPDGYIPLLDSGEIEIRPDCMPDNELLVDFVNPLNEKMILCRNL